MLSLLLQSAKLLIHSFSFFGFQREGAFFWGGLELIGIGSFLMVEYHKSSAAYANQLKLCVRKTSSVAPIRRKMSLTP